MKSLPWKSFSAADGLSLDLRDYLPLVAILAAVLLWGASFAAMRISVKVLEPAAVMWLRMAIALLVLLPLAGRLRPRQIARSDWKLLLPMVFCQPCLYFLLESNALRLTTSSQAGVVAASVPIWVAAGAGVFLGERITFRSAAGLALAVIGVAGLTLMEGRGVRAQNPLLGNGLELAAMVCAAVNILLVKQLSRRYNPWSLTAMQVLAGAIFFAPGALMAWRTPQTLWSPVLVGALLFLGAFVTLGAFGFYNWGMSRIPASRASAFINLVPVVAVIIGWMALGEALSTRQCLSALVVMGGVWLSQSRPATRSVSKSLRP